MIAHEKNMTINSRLSRRGIDLALSYIDALRRAELTLHRWCELKCGDGNDYASWSIERDEKTNKPYRVVYPHNSNNVKRYLVPDRENGALKRIAAICKDAGLNYFYQTDPRGCALYVSKEPLTDTNYTNGIAMCI